MIKFVNYIFLKFPQKQRPCPGRPPQKPALCVPAGGRRGRACLWRWDKKRLILINCPPRPCGTVGANEPFIFMPSPLMRQPSGRPKKQPPLRSGSFFIAAQVADTKPRVSSKQGQVHMHLPLFAAIQLSIRTTLPCNNKRTTSIRLFFGVEFVNQPFYSI